MTWQWLATILIGMVLTLGGYSFKDLSKTVDANEKKRQEIEVSLAEERSRREAEWKEINRRFDRLDRSIDEVREALRQMRRF